MLRCSTVSKWYWQYYTLYRYACYTAAAQLGGFRTRYFCSSAPQGFSSIGSIQSYNTLSGHNLSLSSSLHYTAGCWVLLESHLYQTLVYALYQQLPRFHRTHCTVKVVVHDTHMLRVCSFNLVFLCHKLCSSLQHLAFHCIFFSFLYSFSMHMVAVSCYSCALHTYTQLLFFSTVMLAGQPGE